MKIYYQNNIDPWWCYQVQNILGISRTTEKHIEDVLKERNLLWNPWKKEFGVVTLKQDASGAEVKDFLIGQQLPRHIKIDFGGYNQVYLYRVQVSSIVNSEMCVGYAYLQDTYMTRHHYRHQIAKRINPEVKHIMGYRNEMNINNDDPNNIKISINSWKTPIFAQFADEQIQPLKEESWWTNADELLTINTLPYTYKRYDVLTKNNTYMYVLCNSSAAINVVKGADGYPVAFQQGSNKLFLIPITDPEDILAMQRIDVGASFKADNWDNTDFSTLNPLAQGVFMKAYTSMWPPSVLFAAAVKQNIGVVDESRYINYRYNDNSPLDKANYKKRNIGFLSIDATAGIDVLLRHFEIKQLERYEDSIGSRIFRFLETFDSERNTENCIMAMSPIYYTEEVNLDNEYKIEYSLADILINSSYNDILEKFDISCRVCFNYGETTIYNFGVNTNENNPNYNNTASNKRFNNPWEVNILGSAAANMFSQGPTNMYTGIANNNAANKLTRQQEALNITDRTAQYVGDLAKAVGEVKWYAPFTSGAKAAGMATAATLSYATDISRIVIESDYQVRANNRQLANTISNSLSQPSQAISSPYIGSYAVVPLDSDNKPKLFRTFLNKIPSWEWKRKWEESWEYGHKIKMVGNYNDYQNRDYFNLIKLDTDYNTSYMKSTIQEVVDEERPGWLFGGEVYTIDWMSWIASGVNFERFLNITPKEYWKYNIESDIGSYVDDLDTPKISIKTIIKDNQYIGVQGIPNTDDIKMLIQGGHNPTPVGGWDAFWLDMDILIPDEKNATIAPVIMAKRSSEKFRGSAIINIVIDMSNYYTKAEVDQKLDKQRSIISNSWNQTTAWYINFTGNNRLDMTISVPGRQVIQITLTTSSSTYLGCYANTGAFGWMYEDGSFFINIGWNDNISGNTGWKPSGGTQTANIDLTSTNDVAYFTSGWTSFGVEDGIVNDYNIVSIDNRLTSTHQYRFSNIHTRSASRNIGRTTNLIVEGKANKI